MSTANAETTATVRSVFLSVVRAVYWDFADEGILEAGARPLSGLLTSVELALANEGESPGLQDFEYLLEEMQHSGTWLSRFANSIGGLLDKNGGLGAAQDKIDCIASLSSFIGAHKSAQHAAAFFGDGGEIDTPEEVLVIEESKEKVALAEAKLAEFDPRFKSHVQTWQMCRVLQTKYVHYINEVCEQGVLTQSEVLLLLLLLLILLLLFLLLLLLLLLVVQMRNGVWNAPFHHFD